MIKKCRILIVMPCIVYFFFAFIFANTVAIAEEESTEGSAESSGKGIISIYGSVAFPSQDYLDDNIEVGGGMGMRLLYIPKKNFGFGVKFGIRRLGMDDNYLVDDPVLENPVTADLGVTSWELNFGTSYKFGVEKIHPYIGIYGGLYQFRLNGDIDDDIEYTDSTTRFGFNGEVGIRFPLTVFDSSKEKEKTDKTGVFLDIGAEDHYVLTSHEDTMFYNFIIGITLSDL